MMNILLEHLVDLPDYGTVKPFELALPTRPGVPRSNCFFESCNAEIADMRLSNDRPSIGKEGFEYVQHASQWAALLQEHDNRQADSTVLASYLDEVVSLLEEQFQAEQVIITDWRVLTQSFEVEDLG